MFKYSMLRSSLTSSGLRATQGFLLLALSATLLAAGSLAPRAEAKSAQRVDLGAQNLRKLTPNCGKDLTRDCTVEGKVTAFQSLSANQAGRNFAVPFDGKLVSWTISLARPTRVDMGADHPAQLPNFNLIFGAPSQAGIAVLRQVEKKKKGGPRFKLLRRSTVQTLNRYFGSKVTFALDTPLDVRKDNVIALVIPTWVPALWSPKVCNFDAYYGELDPDRCDKARERYTWRGSRVPRGDGDDVCALRRDDQGEPNEQLANTRPQTGTGSVRRYGCYYGGNVLLYSATIVGR